MLKDPGTVWNVYKYNGYIPLNYIIRHDFKQSVDFFMEEYDHTLILTHILDQLSPVSVKLFSQSPSYAPGSPLELSIDFTNHESSSAEFFAWIDVGLLGSGIYYPMTPLIPITLNGSEVKTIPIDNRVPMTTPLGTYNLRVHIGGVGGLWYKESIDVDIDT